MPVLPQLERELAAAERRLADRGRGRVRLPPWLPLWPAVGGISAALAAGVVAAVVLLSSSAPAAYAGWTPVPTTPSPAALASATAACNWERRGLSGPVMHGRPVLSDARGRYTAALYVFGDRVFECISDGIRDHTGSGMNNMTLRFYAAPRPDQLGLPAGGGGSAPGFSPADQETHLEGRAGSDIATVTFTFADRTTVHATVQNGWYFAWWPRNDYPTSVHIRTTAGATITSPMPASKCRAHAKSCVFAGFRRLRPKRAPPTTRREPPAAR